jgi:hypothetical protein
LERSIPNTSSIKIITAMFFGHKIYLIKTNILLFVILSLSGRIFSQAYTTFNFETGVWNCSAFMMEDGSSKQQYYCLGDTVIQDTTWYKLYRYAVYLPIYGMPDTSFTFFGLIRNDPAKRVWLNGEILYDFNLEVGDTIPFAPYVFNNKVICRIDSVQLCNRFHKRYVFDTNYSEVHALIEGVGSTLGFYDPIVNPFESTSQLDCYGERGNNFCDECNTLLEVISRNSNEFSIKSPVNGKLTLTGEFVPGKQTMIRLVSLSGQTVLVRSIADFPAAVDVHFLPEGIYLLLIENGHLFEMKKVVIFGNN